MWVALVDSVAGGDQFAFRELFERMHTLVYTLTLRIVQDRQTAEEVTLDVFEGVWQRAGDYDAANGTVVGWIMNQARSRAIDRIRHDTRQKRVNPWPDTEEPQPVADSASTIDRGKRDVQLRAAVAQLTPHERSAIEMAYFAGHSYAEVAIRLGQPAGTIKTRIRSGLGKLRRHLTRDESAPGR